MVVIVTRPANAGRRLVDRIVERGLCAVWWPAFDIGPSPDEAAARAALARLNDYQLAIFVSAHAVSATRSLLDAPWPMNTVIGAVGASTRQAVAAELQLPQGAVVIAPHTDYESGSEAFWQAWQDSRQTARRVLLLRSEEGRNWLVERLVDSGAEVEAVAVYARRTHVLHPADQARLREWFEAGVQPATIFSSTEAVAALDAQVAEQQRIWLRAGFAVACHPRIARELKASGYARVMDATFDDDLIIAKLESIQPS